MIYNYDRRIVASVEPTIKGFLAILSGLLIQQDKAESSRGRGNPYALSHWVEAKHKAEDRVKSVINSSDPEDLKALKASLSREFTADFPPLRKILKAIDAYISTGKAPKYPVTPAARLPR